MTTAEQKLALPDAVDSILSGNINRKVFDYLHRQSPYFCDSKELMLNVWEHKGMVTKQVYASIRNSITDLRRLLRFAQVPFTIYGINYFQAWVMTDKPLPEGSQFLTGQDQDFCSSLRSDWQEPARRMFRLTVDGQKLQPALTQTGKNLVKNFLVLPDKVWSNQEIAGLIWPLDGPDVDPVVDLYNKRTLSGALERTNQKLLEGNCGVAIANKIGHGYFLQRT